jgi:putative protein-disulfide isomerase
MVSAAVEAGISVSLHGGELWSTPTRLAPDRADYIRTSDRRIAAMTGQSFGDAYLTGLLDDPESVFWSAPPIAAVLAAGDLRPGADVQMLHAIQLAHYLDGRRVVEADVLRSLAVSIGLEPEAFERALQGDQASAHVERSLDLMRRTGLRGYPGFVVETHGVLVRMPHETFYGRPAAFVDAVSRAAARTAA